MQRRGIDAVIDGFAVAPLPSYFHAVHALAATYPFSKASEFLLTLHRHAREWPAHYLLGGPAEHFLSRRIPNHFHVSLKIQTNNARRRGLNDGTKQVVGLLQFPLGLFALGDVLADEEDHRVPVGRPRGARGLSYPQNAPVLTNFAKLPVSHLHRIAQTSRELSPDSFSVVWVENHQDWLTHQLLDSVAKLFCSKPIDGEHRALVIHGEIHRRVVFVQSPVAFFALSQRFFRPLALCDVPGNSLQARRETILA